MNESGHAQHAHETVSVEGRRRLLLFDPFYRVLGSRSRDTGGAGLGLTIVKTCVEACGGSVSCRNRKPTGFEALVSRYLRTENWLQCLPKARSTPKAEINLKNLPKRNFYNSFTIIPGSPHTIFTWRESIYDEASNRTLIGRSVGDWHNEITKKLKVIMKTKISFILGLAFAAGILAVQAQNTPVQSTTPTSTPGPAWRLTPEQRAERQQFIQATVLNLQARRDNGTISANEKAWLDRMEQAGGLCVNGVPRGGGRGAGLGPRNGTGPRAQLGICPLVNGSPAVLPPATGFRGCGCGMGWRGGCGRGQGGGFGMRNGTGPRAQVGTCPLLAPSLK